MVEVLLLIIDCQFCAYKSDAQDALAIFVAEGVAGALGGIAAKGVSFIDGNKNNRDSALINAGTAGAYFGVAGAVRSLAEVKCNLKVNFNI